MNSPASEIVEGITAGLVATAPMTWALWATDRWLPLRAQRRLPPKQITEKLLEKAEVKPKLDKRQRDAAANVTHYAFGAAAGGLMALAAKASPLPKPVTGALVGTGVWAASYLGWLPALGLRRSAARDHAGRNVQMIAAHLVWGAVAGALLDRLDRFTVES